MKHIDLFSGIGGFALAAEWAGFRTEVFCENDPFCQEVLKQRFGVIADAKFNRLQRDKSDRSKADMRRRSPYAPVLISDIRDFDGSRFRGAALLTGGFPCQPFSCAGKRRGKADDRWLWPEMCRVIKEAKPTWIIAENVPGIIKMELGQVLSDLANIGYDFPRDHNGYPIIPVMPACGVNAPHKRNRVWIIGYAYHHGQRGLLRKAGQREDQPEFREDIDRENPGTFRSRTTRDAPDSVSSGRDRGTKRPGREQEIGAALSWPNRHAPDAAESGWRQGNKDTGGSQEGKGAKGTGRRPPDDRWDIPWPEVAARLCRMDDGLPRWIHRHRIQRLKALGNAIVPQVAYEIIKGIAEIEENLICLKTKNGGYDFLRELEKI